MYSTTFWCLFVVLLCFWLYCVTTVTPFIERRAETTRQLGSCTVKKRVQLALTQRVQALAFSQCKSLVDVSFPPYPLSPTPFDACYAG